MTDFINIGNYRYVRADRIREAHFGGDWAEDDYHAVIDMGDGETQKTRITSEAFDEIAARESPVPNHNPNLVVVLTELDHGAFRVKQEPIIAWVNQWGLSYRSVVTSWGMYSSWVYLDRTTGALYDAELGQLDESYEQYCAEELKRLVAEREAYEAEYRAREAERLAAKSNGGAQ